MGSSGDPQDAGPTVGRGVALPKTVRQISLMLGALELLGGILELFDEDWRNGATSVGVGLFLLLAGSPWWSRMGLLARRRTVSAAQKRRSAWLRSHPVAVGVIFGAVFTAYMGGLIGSRMGHWPLGTAVCAPGGAVFGWLMVRELGRTAPSSEQPG